MKTAKEINSIRDNTELKEAELVEKLTEEFLKAHEEEFELSLTKEGYFVILNETLEEFTDWKKYNIGYSKIKSLVAKKLKQLGFFVEKQTFGWANLVVALSEKIGEKHVDNHGSLPMTEEEWDFANAY